MLKERVQPNYTLFLVLLMIAPFKNLYIYYIIVMCIVVLFTFRTKSSWNLSAQVLGAFILYITTMAAVRSAYFTELNYRDYVESFRFVPLLYLLLKRDYFQKITYDSIVKACWVYLLIDGAVSMMQYANSKILGIVDIVRTLYTSEGFFAKADMFLLHRTPGISFEIAGHGAVLMSLTIVMLSAIMNKTSSKLLSYLGFIVCILLLIMNQSRTAFVATGVALILYSLYYVAFGNLSQRGKLIMLCVILFSVSAFIATNYRSVLYKVPYLLKLSDANQTAAATAGRFRKWARFSDAAWQNPWLMIPGWGKHFFGRASGGFDNDYLYAFYVYGPSVLICFLLMGASYGLKVLLNCRKYVLRNFEMAFFFVLLGGAIIASATTYFLLPQIVFLLYFLYCGRYWETKSNVISKPIQRRRGRW